MRRTICSLWLVLLCSTVCSAQSEVVELPEKEKFHLFLLIGQSNMAGRGKVEAQDKQPHPRVLTLSRDSQWVPAVDPLHFDKPAVVGVGLGRTFGIQVAEAMPDVVVGLVPCAVGGSPIASWEPGGYHDQTRSHPYDDAMIRIKRALQDGTLKGILWHQGEADARPQLAEKYQAQLDLLVARLRNELHAPSVPFLVGQLGQFPERPWDEAKRQVDRALRSLPQRIAWTAYVPSDGLTHKGDEVHFDAASCREFGQRFARAYLQMQP